MSFKAEKVNEFKEIFSENWVFISSFKGCRHVELLQDKTEPNVFFTFSVWDDERFLEEYRNSLLFEDVWGKTKILFNAKPEAWTLNELKFLIK
jgi:(4S)-4-hydroxy-5-phosphonooxypentane-2,3-dione isomerase